MIFFSHISLGLVIHFFYYNSQTFLRRLHTFEVKLKNNLYKFIDKE
jgi:hypothetical protein